METEKIQFGATSVWVLILLEQFQKSTWSDTGQENTSPFLSHIDNSIPTFSYMSLPISI